MSHYGKNTCDQKTTVIDHEKKYQEDLEQAKALSLESLALEKYRLEKLRLELSNVQQACLAQNNVCNTNSVSETDCSQGDRCIFLRSTFQSAAFNFAKLVVSCIDFDNFYFDRSVILYCTTMINNNNLLHYMRRSHCRSRPRPSINTNQKSTVILAPPPPIPCRRNSTTTTSNQDSSTDLINFTSPVKQDNLAEYCSAPPPPPP